MIKLILSFWAASCLLYADFDVQRWQFQRPIQVRSAAPVAMFTVDQGVYRSSTARLQDLRIVQNGAEIPYELQVLAGTQEETELATAILDKTVNPRAGLQAVLDLSGHAQHNRLRLSTGQKNFKEKVKVETSDDRRNWALVRDDGFIFDISQQDRHASNLAIEYALSTRRYVRLTIPGWKRPDDLQAAWLTHHKETSAVRDLGPTLTPIVSQDRKLQTTSLSFDIGFEGMPYDRLELAVNSGMFFRNAEVSASSDGKQWLFAGNGVVSRTAERSQLSVPIAEQWNRYIRLTVFNGDDAPLPIDSITISNIRRIVKFPVKGVGLYWLYSGNTVAKAPSYDFARLITSTTATTAVSLGEMKNNLQYRSPHLPWTDRHPDFLMAVLIVAVVVMGYVTLRFFTKLNTTPLS